MKHPFALLAALLVLPGCSGGGGSDGGDGGGGTTPRAVTGDALLYPFTGQKRVLFLIVRFLDDPGLFEVSADGEAEVQSIAQDVADALARNSNGKLLIDVDYTWPPLPIDRNVGDYDEVGAQVHVRSDAVHAARAAGYVVEDYDRDVLFTPKVWSGANAARGWTRAAWMSHKLRWVVLHELGHTLGRGHANFWDGDPVGAGTEVEYGDVFDPMGTGRQWNRELQPNPFFKLRANWLDPGEVANVTASGTYSLGSLESPNPARGPSALRIRRDATHDYWIFHRASEPLVANGPVIVKTGTNPYAPTLLLDMNPGSAGDEVEDCALAPGQVFDDSAQAGLIVENVSLPGDRVQLRITLDEGRQLGLDRVPVIDVLSPRQDDLPQQGTMTLEVAAHDPQEGAFDGDGIVQVELSVLDIGQDPITAVFSRTFTEAPYRVDFDTQGTPDGFYYLQVDATAADGGTNRIWYRFVVDNYAGTLTE